MRADHYLKQTWVEDLHTFVTPFWPEYRQAKFKEAKYLNGNTVDYSHEREWRVPHDFSFKLSQVEFIVLPTYKEMAKFPEKLKDAIGREKFCSWKCTKPSSDCGQCIILAEETNR